MEQDMTQKTYNNKIRKKRKITIHNALRIKDSWRQQNVGELRCSGTSGSSIV